MQITCERPAGWASALECVLEEDHNPFISLMDYSQYSSPLPGILGSRSESNFHVPVKLQILI